MAHPYEYESPNKFNPKLDFYFNPIWEGEMWKKSNLHKIVNSAVSTTIEGFPILTFGNNP